MCVLTTTCFALLGALPQAPDVPVSDTARIDWVLPGEFESARRRAEDERKILLVKGVSFGIDRIGAVDATRGQW